MNAVTIIYFVYFVLWGLNFWFVVRCKDSKLVCIATWLLMFIIFASSAGIDGDAYKYKIDYELGVFGDNWSETGNELLKIACKLLGLLTYNQYLIVLFLISSILCYFGIKRVEGNCHMLFVAMMGFLFPSMAVAIRFLISFSFFVFSFGYLVKGNRLKYFIGVLCAISFHRSAIIFLIFLFADSFGKHVINRKNRLFLVYAIGGTAVVITIYTLLARRLPFVSMLSSLILYFQPNIDNKVAAYLGSFTRFGFLIVFIVYIVNYMFGWHMMNSAKSSNNWEIKRFTELGYTINVLSAVLLPLTVVNLVFFRLYAVQTFVNCITFAKIERPYVVTTGKIKVSGVLYVLASLTWIIPELCKINSISIYNTIASTFFANL